MRPSRRFRFRPACTGLESRIALSDAPDAPDTADVLDDPWADDDPCDCPDTADAEPDPGDLDDGLPPFTSLPPAPIGPAGPG